MEETHVQNNVRKSVIRIRAKRYSQDRTLENKRKAYTKRIRWVQEIANSYVDQQQEPMERRDAITV